MALVGREIARRTSGRVEVRDSAVRARVRLESLAASDAHLIEANFTCGVTALNEPVELKMLAEAFLSDKDVVDAEHIASHFTPALLDAAIRAAEKQPADHWLTDAGRAELLNALRAAAKPVAFNCGVELLPPFELSITSPTREREKLESIHRELSERRVTGQAEHVQRAAMLLKQFQSLRDAAPGLSPGQVLEQVNDADRGSMLQTLLLASASATQQTLFAVAGSNLIKIDPRKSRATCELIALPTTLGPLRSVQSGEIDGARALLIGAQSGIWTARPDGSHACAFADAEMTSALGFNSVATTSNMIWATHAEAGMVGWRLDEPAKPALTLRPESSADAARNAFRLDSRRAIYSAGNKIFVINEEPREMIIDGSSPVVSIFDIGNEIVIVRSSGVVERYDCVSMQHHSTEQRSGEIISAAELPWLGTTRLLLATADGPVCCVGLDDSVITQYTSAHRGLRALAAASDIVAGVSADRQRIIIWKSWEPRQPAAEIHVTALARHRVADLCFA